jgi:excisionase family DNA binding protein
MATSSAPEIGAGRLLISYGEAATALAVSPRYLRGLVYQGVIPSVRLGRLRRIAMEDLTAFVKQLRNEAQPRARAVTPCGGPVPRSPDDLNLGSRRSPLPSPAHV